MKITVAIAHPFGDTHREKEAQRMMAKVQALRAKAGDSADCLVERGETKPFNATLCLTQYTFTFAS